CPKAPQCPVRSPGIEPRNACLLLTFKDPADWTDELFEPGTRFPAVERDLVAGRKVRLEVAAQPRSHCCFAERDVDFVVVLERSVVEVRRSDDRPRSIDEQRFHMCHRRTEFVYAHSAFEQLPLQASAGH